MVEFSVLPLDGVPMQTLSNYNRFGQLDIWTNVVHILCDVRLYVSMQSQRV